MHCEHLKSVFGSIANFSQRTDISVLHKSAVGTHSSAITKLLCCIALTACESSPFSKSPDDQPSVAQVALLVQGDPVADRATLLQLTATLLRGDPENSVVNLTTSAGAFVPSNTVYASAAFGNALATGFRLRAPANEGLVVIRTAVRNAVRTDTIRFRQARPDTVLLQPRDSFVVRSDPPGVLYFTATLRRANGLVSPGTLLSLSDVPPAGPSGVFGVPTPVDTLGKFEFSYTPGQVDGAGRGPRRIFACSDGAVARVCGVTTVFVR